MPAALHREDEGIIWRRPICREARLSRLLVLLSGRDDEAGRGSGLEYPGCRKPPPSLHPDRPALADEFSTKLRRDQGGDGVRRQVYAYLGILPRFGERW